MIVTTTRTWDGTKLYLDSRGNVTTSDPRPLRTGMTRYDFERLSLLTLAQVTLLPPVLPFSQHKQR
jgi:hypothetical protein